MLAIGAYPAVSLAAARAEREAAKALLRQGRDPSTKKRLRRAASAEQQAATFEVAARRWHRPTSETRSATC